MTFTQHTTHGWDIRRKMTISPTEYVFIYLYIYIYTYKCTGPYGHSSLYSPKYVMNVYGYACMYKHIWNNNKKKQKTNPLCEINKPTFVQNCNYKNGLNTGGKRLIYGAKHSKDNSLKAWKTNVGYPIWEHIFDTKRFRGGRFSPISY